MLLSTVPLLLARNGPCACTPCSFTGDDRTHDHVLHLTIVSRANSAWALSYPAPTKLTSRHGNYSNTMAAPDIETGIYFIQNYGTGTVLDLTNGNAAKDTLAQGFKRRNLDDVWVPCQLWLINSLGNHEYIIQNVVSRTYLKGRSNSEQVVGYPGINTENPYRWFINLSSKGTSYVIQNKGSKGYLDLDKGGTVDHTKVITYSGDGSVTTNPNQLWHIVRV